MLYIIDRFEGSYAVCENSMNQMINIEKNKLPIDAKEGDVLQVTDGVFYVDVNETKKRKEKIKSLMNELWND